MVPFAAEQSLGLTMDEAAACGVTVTNKHYACAITASKSAVASKCL